LFALASPLRHGIGDHVATRPPHRTVAWHRGSRCHTAATSHGGMASGITLPHGRHIARWHRGVDHVATRPPHRTLSRRGSRRHTAGTLSRRGPRRHTAAALSHGGIAVWPGAFRSTIRAVPFSPRQPHETARPAAVLLLLVRGAWQRHAVYRPVLPRCWVRPGADRCVAGARRGDADRGRAAVGRAGRGSCRP
jgi:hypothetical protein